MSLLENLNKLNKNISEDAVEQNNILDATKEFKKAIGAEESDDNTLDELIAEIAEELPEKIGGSTPTGKITITENGSDIDVSEYASADVDVAQDFTVSENYTVSEGKLTSADVKLVGDVVATIPDGVTEISAGAFSHNYDINKVVLSSSVNTIQDGQSFPPNYGVFYECKNLKEIIFNNQLTSIGKYAFYGCSKLINALIPNNVTNIGIYAFASCLNLSSVTIPNSLTTISTHSFDLCTSLASIIIPSNIIEIGDSAFEGSGLTDIYYTGTQAEWEQITIGTDAIPQGVTVHYDYVPE